MFLTVCSPKISKIRFLDFEFNAMGMEKKLPRSKVFDFSIMKSLVTK